jgi:hypothetical protein
MAPHVLMAGYKSVSPPHTLSPTYALCKQD